MDAEQLPRCPVCGELPDGAGPSSFICPKGHKWPKGNGRVRVEDEILKAHAAQRMAEGPKGGLDIVSGEALLKMEFPDPPWIVPNLLPVGLTLLGGRPKTGKSWLALQATGAIGSGGMFLGYRVERGKCLYLALEDSLRRLQGRMRLQNWPADADVDFMIGAGASPILPLNRNGNAAALARLIAERGYRLVIIDTLSRALSGDQNDVRDMTTALGPLQEAAHAQNCAIVLIDHHAKGAANLYAGDSETAPDPVLSILGSTAKGAVADTLWGLSRQRGRVGAVLAITGRDVEEQRLALRQDPITRIWQCEGIADAVRITTNREAILDALRRLGPSQLTTIAKAVGQDKSNTNKRLQDMVSAGLVRLQQVGGIPVYSLATEENTEVPTTSYHSYHTYHSNHTYHAVVARGSCGRPSEATTDSILEKSDDLRPPRLKECSVCGLLTLLCGPDGRPLCSRCAEAGLERVAGGEP